MVASAQRIGWTVCDAQHLITDVGESLDLKSDPPVVVEKEVHEAVRRWRWRRVAEKHQHLSHGTSQVQFEPVSKVLNARKLKGHSVETTRNIQSGLRSAITSRQWPQLRCHQAGYTPHNRCWLCAADFFKKLDGNERCTDERLLGWLESTEPGNCEIPVGSLEHRVWHCPFFAKERAEFSSKCMCSAISGEFDMAEDFRQAHSTGLFPEWQHPTYRSDVVKTEGSFEWVMLPTGGVVKARFYTDGSRMDEKRGDMIRFGWAFVAMDHEERIVAIARGVPPHWIVDIPGTEAWALHQARIHAEPGSTFRSDCKPCVDAITEGAVRACSAKRPLARVNRQLHHAFDDTGPGSVLWMPAHTAEADIGVKKLSDGSKLTATDRRLNGRADEQAKIATEAVRVPVEIRQDYDCYMQNIEDASIWLGMVTWMANNLQGAVKRDSGASGAKAAQLRGQRQAKTGKRRWHLPVTRRPSDGGHLLVSKGAQQWCAFCGVSGTSMRLDTRSVRARNGTGGWPDPWSLKCLPLTTSLSSARMPTSVCYREVWSGAIGAVHTAPTEDAG